MPKSAKTQRYITVFMNQVQRIINQNAPLKSLIDTVLATAKGGVEGVSSGLDGLSSDTAGAISKLVGLAGIVALATAPPSAGLSLAIAGGVISALQTAVSGYRFVKKQMGHKEVVFLTDEIQFDSDKLVFDLLFGEIASTLALQYHYFIEVVATDDGINDLARYAANAVLTQWLTLTQQKKTITQETLCAELFAHTSRFSKTPIEVQKESTLQTWGSSLFSSTYNAQNIYSRPILIHFDITDETHPWSAYEPNSPAKLPTFRVINKTTPPNTYKSKSMAKLPEPSTSFFVEYRIDSLEKRHVVSEYLATLTKDGSKKNVSLNDYLSQRFHANLIATCHDNTLSGLDLSDGVFSSVNFRRADLSGCSLTRTRWDQAELQQAILGSSTTQTLLTDSFWQDTHLECTQWTNVDFAQTTLLQTNLRGAVFKNCQFANLTQVGCQWDLAEWDNTEPFPQPILQQLATEKAAENDKVEAVRALSQRLRDSVSRCESDLSDANPGSFRQLSEFLCDLPSQIERLQSTTDQDRNVQLDDLNHQMLSLQTLMQDYHSSSQDTQTALSGIQKWKASQEAKQEKDALFQAETLSQLQILQTSLLDAHTEIALIKKSLPKWPTMKSRRAKHQEMPEPLHALFSEFLRTFKDKRLKETLENYIEPYATSLISTDSPAIPLTEIVDEFSQDDIHMLLIRGVVGSGKSSYARTLQKKLWDEWQNEMSWVPLLIELKDIEPGSKNFLTEQLRTVYQYSDDQINQLKKTYRFFIIFDGVDECPNIDTRCLLRDCRLDLWNNAKVVVTGRSEWFETTENSHERLTAPRASTGHHYTIKTCAISAVTAVQRNEYLDVFFTQQQQSPTPYIDFLNSSEELGFMAESPLMLNILCQILPILMTRTQSQETSTPYARFELYDLFFSSWFECYKLSDPQYLYYAQALALNLFKENTLSVIRKPQQQQSQKLFGKADWLAPQDIWIAFFGNPKTQEAERLCPLSMERIIDEDNAISYRYQFIHKSFMEHLVSTLLFNNLSDKTESIETYRQNWNLRYLTEEPEILNFLAERIKKSPKRKFYEERLLAMVLSTRKHTQYAKAGSSAITLLNELSYDFYNDPALKHDLSRIQIPNARLNGLFFPDGKLSHCDLSGVNFDNAMLVNTTLEHSNLTGTRFLPNPSVAFTQNRPRILAVHPTHPDSVAYVENNDIILVRLSDGHITNRIENAHTGQIINLTFAPDGTLASSCSNNIICLWDVTEPQMYRCINLINRDFNKPQNAFDRFPADAQHTISVFSFSHDEKQLDNDYSPVEGKSTISALSFSHDGAMLAVGRSNGSIFIISSPQSAEKLKIQTFESRHIDKILSLAFSGDGQLLASGGHDQRICIWQVQGLVDQHTCLHTLQGHTDSITSLIFKALPYTLYSGSNDKTIRVWNLQHLLTRSKKEAKLTPLAKATLPGSMSALTTTIGENTRQPTVFSRIEQHQRIDLTHTVVSKKKHIPFCDVEFESKTVDPCIQVLKDHKHCVSNLTLSPNGLFLASSSREDQTIRIWDISSLEKGPRCISVLTGHSEGVSNIGFCSDDTIISGSFDQSIRLWDLKQPHFERQLPRFKGHTQPISGLSFSPSGDMLASGGQDKIIHLWNAQGEWFKTLQGHTGRVTCVSYAVDGKLASGSEDETIRIWSPNGECTHSLTPEAGYVESLAFSPDGTQLASSHWNKTIYIWDLTKSSDEACQQCIHEHDDVVYSLAFNWDGTILASGGLDKTIRLWNLQKRTSQPHPTPRSGSPVHEETTQVLITPERKKKEITHPPLTDIGGRDVIPSTHSVSSLAFAPDRNLLVSGDSQGHICFFDLASGLNQESKITAHKDPVSTLIFTADGQKLLSASKSEIYLWDLSRNNEQCLTLPFGSNYLSLHGTILSFAHGNAIYALDLLALTAVPTTTSRDVFAGSSTDVDSRLRGQAAERRRVGAAAENDLHTHKWLKKGPCSLWLQQCKLVGAQGIHLSMQQFLQAKGAKENSALWIDSLLDEHQTPLYSTSKKTLSSLSPTTSLGDFDEETYLQERPCNRQQKFRTFFPTCGNLTAKFNDLTDEMDHGFEPGSFNSKKPATIHQEETIAFPSFSHQSSTLFSAKANGALLPINTKSLGQMTDASAEAKRSAKKGSPSQLSPIKSPQESLTRKPAFKFK